MNELITWGPLPVGQMQTYFAITIYSPNAGHLAHLIKHANLIKSGDVMKMAELGWTASPSKKKRMTWQIPRMRYKPVKNNCGTLGSSTLTGSQFNKKVPRWGVRYTISIYRSIYLSTYPSMYLWRVIHAAYWRDCQPWASRDPQTVDLNIKSEGFVQNGSTRHW